MKERIEVPALARVEGEGGLFIALKNGEIEELRLDIYEPPRFFEGFLRGRHYQEVPDITARICGICPVAYQMSSVQALERALAVPVTEAVRDLRRLFYCAEYIESHALHMYMLQAPDLLGHESALSLAQEAPEVVRGALRLKKSGNTLLAAIGGRSVHPVNACVGGFYRWPDREPLRALIPEFEWGLSAAREAVRWAASLPYPQLEADYEFVALHREDEYAILDGDILSSRLELLTAEDYEANYLEQQVPHSTAFHSRTPDGDTYLVGPLARINLNFAQLGEQARQAAEDVGFSPPLHNPYMSLLARALELVEVYDVALKLLRDYHPDEPSRVEIELRAGEGSGASEAPRGLLYHRYRIDEAGLIETARIVPPTAQNLARIEDDLRQLVPGILELPHAEATLRCEELVRAYDPCISCSTHFLEMKLEQR